MRLQGAGTFSTTTLQLQSIREARRANVINRVERSRKDKMEVFRHAIRRRIRRREISIWPAAQYLSCRSIVEHSAFPWRPQQLLETWSWTERKSSRFASEFKIEFGGYQNGALVYATVRRSGCRTAVRTRDHVAADASATAVGRVK